MTAGVRIVATNSENEVLLVRHTYVSGWHLPGGGLERGETFEDAARKELLEETGFEPLDAIELKSIHYNTKASPRDHVALYICFGVREVTAFAPNHEIAEIGFFDLTALPSEITPGTKARLTEVFDGVKASSRW